jgi:hypothetical protein
MRVSSGANCSKRDARRTARSRLEQARAGLLAAVVSRQAAATKMYRLRFERDLDDRNRPTKMRVHADRDTNVGKSFLAARPAADFVKLGFRADSATGATYFGPDVETLLDDAFRDGYCFELDRDRNRARQIGLRFVPAGRQRGRIDIEGTLWIDTTARELRDIQFKYLGLERLLDDVNAGGRIEFRQLSNGATLIDRWAFRLPALHVDTSYDNRNNLPVAHTYALPREMGGEVASAEWPDGVRFQGSLGTLRLIPVDHSGRPVRNVVVRLEDTDYIGSPDSTGVVEFTDLLPGPYRVMVIDSALARIGVQVPTNISFTAERGNITQRRAQLTTAIEFVRKGCADVYRHEPDSTVGWFVGRVYDVNDVPANHFKFQVGREAVTGEVLGMLDASGITSSDGLFFACGGYDASDFLRLTVTNPLSKKSQDGRIKATGRLTVTAFRLGPEPY